MGSKGFYDLSVTYENKSALINVLRTSVELGYRTVAINQIVTDVAVDTSKKKKKGGPKDTGTSDVVPLPIDINDIPQELKDRLKILNRVTIYYSDTNQGYRLAQSENIKKFDIFAVIPSTQAALQHVCSTIDADIISVDPCSKPSLRWNRKLYNVAVEREIWFELPYAMAVLDSSARRNLINIGHLYHAYGKSKNVIVSSGAGNPMQVRGPYDVINLSLLLGMSEEQAKSAITNAGRSVLLRGERRQRGKGVILIERLQDLVVKQEASLNSSVEDDSVNEPALKKMRVQNT